MKKTITLLFLTILITISTLKAQKIIALGNDDLSVKISSFGAELQSIKNSAGTEYLWQGDSAYWENRAPVMFPVNVRFKDERYTYKGVEYEMPRMGLAKIADFKVLSTTDSHQAVLEFSSNKKTLKNYPFAFRLEVTYRLDENKLINQFIVENTGKENMFFALGGHPGFRFPFIEERGRNQYTFSEEFDLKRTEIANSLVQPNEIRWLENENSLPLGDSRIPNGGMFVKKMPSRKIGVGVVVENPFVEIDLGDFPNVNLWSPPGMPYACIEPMVGHHDTENSPLAIEEKSYLINLPPGQSKTYQFTIEVNPKRQIVNSVAELQTAVSKAKPGDVIELGEGNFDGENITISAKGTETEPILIKALNKGKTFFNSPVKIYGDYISLSGVNFADDGNLEI